MKRKLFGKDWNKNKMMVFMELSGCYVESLFLRIKSN